MSVKDPSNWDRNASEYEKMPVEGPIYVPCKKMLANMNAALPFSIASAILDVGSGPGTAITLLFKEYGASIPAKASVMATDFSAGMIEAIRTRKGREINAADKDIASCWDRLNMDVMDAQDLTKVSSNTMSHVMGSLVYFMLPDPRKGLAEAHRVLEHDGVFACTSWAKIEWMEFLTQAAQAVRPDIKPSMKLLETWKTVEGVKGELEAVGFRHAHVEYVEFDWHIPDPSSFVDKIARTENPGAKMAIGHLTNEEVNQCCEEWVKIVASHGNVCKGIAVLGVGRK